jgi:polysaccharide deacetylase 2 family uncharacterized protein YibQ
MKSPQRFSSRFRAPREFSKTSRKNLNRRVLFILILVALALAIVINYKGSFRFSKRLLPSRIKIVDSEDFRRVILDEMYQLGIKEDWTYTKAETEGNGQGSMVKIRVPKDIALTLCNLRIHQLMGKIGGQVYTAEENAPGNIIKVQLGYPNGIRHTVLLKRDWNIERGRIRVALLVDEVGYTDRFVQDIFKLKRNITFCIIPGLSYSREIAGIVRQQGYEVILQAPLATTARASVQEGPQITRSGLGLKADITSGLQEITGVRGICLPVRAKSIEPDCLTAIIKVAQEQSLYYIDTNPRPESPASDLAKKAGLMVGKSRLYLDLDKKSVPLKEQLERLSDYAMKTGTALAVAPLCKETVRAFRDYLPVMEGRGIELVFASEVVD